MLLLPEYRPRWFAYTVKSSRYTLVGGFHASFFIMASVPDSIESWISMPLIELCATLPLNAPSGWRIGTSPEKYGRLADGPCGLYGSANQKPVPIVPPATLPINSLLGFVIQKEAGVRFCTSSSSLSLGRSCSPGSGFFVTSTRLS